MHRHPIATLSSPSESPAGVADVNRCPRCAGFVPSNERFCETCMWRVRPAARAATPPFKSLRGHGVAACMLLAAAAVLSCVMIFGAAVTLDRLPEDGGLSAGDEILVLSSAAAAFVTQFAVCVPVLAWYHRAYSNVHAYWPGAARYHRWWAVVGWLVPVLWFWVPFRVSEDLRRAARDATLSGWLRTWWGAWLALSVVVAVMPVVDSSTSINEQSSGLMWLIAAGVLELLAAIAAIAVILRLTRGLTFAYGQLVAFGQAPDRLG